MFWGATAAETLRHLGVTTAVLCPGSRSAPLTIGFALNDAIETLPVLDERSAAFFALGMAKATSAPVALVCTSGTAVANFLPAVIESHYSHIPLIILTADRPPELRDRSAGQTIDQQKIYGTCVRWFYEMPLPRADLLPTLRYTLDHAVSRANGTNPGPVHLNCPFDDPLVPQPDDTFIAPDLSSFFVQYKSDQFPLNTEYNPALTAKINNHTNRGEKAIIICGSDLQFTTNINLLADKLKCPILTDALGTTRHKANSLTIAHYEHILRNRELAKALKPDYVIIFGQLPTSKTLRQRLQDSGIPLYFVTSNHDNPNPLDNPSLTFNGAIDTDNLDGNNHSEYSEKWQNAESEINPIITNCFSKEEKLSEPKIYHLLATYLPEKTPVFIASSTPVRDAEWFWPASNRHYHLYANRGANGIDGTTSSALGLAHKIDRPAVLITGELAFLHDSNALLLRSNFRGSLTIILINNHGGGIFQNLPIANWEPPFERFFATPHKVEFAQLCAAHNINHHKPESWPAFIKLIKTLPGTGIRLIELNTDRVGDADIRKKLLQSGV